MAESLEALNDKWYHILEERQSKLLDAEHDNQELASLDISCDFWLW